jgi:hypothetical protein
MAGQYTLDASVPTYRIEIYGCVMFRAVFWVVLPCKMIVDRRFRGAYCHQHPLKHRAKIILHGSTTHKTALNIILAAVRT